MKTTNKHKKYWTERKIDWKTSYLDTWDHPHRQLLVWILKTIPFYSLWEVGCGPGANLKKIVQEIPNKQLGGSDVNPEAIELAQKTFKGGLFHVESGENLLMSDNSVDVILSDACLIYVDPTKIKKYLNEYKRVARSHIVLCELHEKNLWKRFTYWLKTGYFMYDYKKLLDKLGYWDIRLTKIPKEFWPGTPWEQHGYIITAKI